MSSSESDVARSAAAQDEAHDSGDIELSGMHETTEQPLRLSVSRDGESARSTFSNFIRFSILFSAVPATALVCLAIATSRFGSLGGWQSGMLYSTYTMSAVAGATYVVKRLGSRDALICGMTLYCCYVLCFLLAAIVPQASAVFALTGAGIGGIGAGIMWTSQGTFFSQAAEQYAVDSGLEREVATSLLAGWFAFILLVEETLMDLLSTLLLRVFNIHWAAIFAIYSSVAICATVSMSSVKAFPSLHNANGLSFLEDLKKSTTTVRLLVQDSKMKYMIGMNASFGFSAAFLHAVVSGVAVPVALEDPDSSFVGLLFAVHGTVAALFSLVSSTIAQTYGKGLVLVVGALAFTLVAFPFLIKPDFASWGWFGLVVVYSLEGIGRATFEGTLKAVFADYFPHEKEGAFANIILQNGIASVAAYILSVRLRCGNESAYCIRYSDGADLHNFGIFGLFVVLVGIMGIAGYCRASYLYHRGPEPALAHQGGSKSTRDKTTYEALAKGIEDGEVGSPNDEARLGEFT